MASTAIKCVPCEQSHRPCSWVAEYCRWHIKQLWGLNDAGLDCLELEASALSSSGSHKVVKVAPRSSGAEVSSSSMSVAVPSPV